MHFAAGRLAGIFGCVGAGCVGAGLGEQELYGVGTHGWGGTYGGGAGAALKQQLGAQLDTHEVEQIGGQEDEPKIITANVWIYIAVLPCGHVRLNDWKSYKMTYIAEKVNLTFCLR